jgi:hypothetical protein
LWRDRLVIPNVNKTMMSYWGKASWAKMTSPGGKQAAMPHHPTKKENKTEELTYLSTNIGLNSLYGELL